MSPARSSLRRDLGLPLFAQRRPVLYDVKIAPYLGAADAGLALGARF